MKFLINDGNILNKSQHVGHICEAYYEKDKNWYAALI